MAIDFVERYEITQDVKDEVVSRITSNQMFKDDLNIQFREYGMIEYDKMVGNEPVDVLEVVVIGKVSYTTINDRKYNGMFQIVLDSIEEYSYKAYQK